MLSSVLAAGIFRKMHTVFVFCDFCDLFLDFLESVFSRVEEETIEQRFLFDGESSYWSE